MAKVIPKKRSVNYDLKKIITNYWEASSLSEKRFDLLLPFGISMILSIGLSLFKLNIVDNTFSEINNISLTIMSILAGFNTASLTIVSSTNLGKFVKLLSDEKDRTKGTSLLDKLVSFFSYAIITQLFLLIIGIIDFVILKFVNLDSNNICLLILFAFMLSLMLAIILHSLFITLRNISVLYRFILFLGSNDKE